MSASRCGSSWLGGQPGPRRRKVRRYRRGQGGNPVRHTPPQNGRQLGTLTITTGTPPSPDLKMARLLSTLSLVAIIAAAASFLVAAGWIPWAAPVVLAALGLMVAGF